MKKYLGGAIFIFAIIFVVVANNDDIDNNHVPIDISVDGDAWQAVRDTDRAVVTESGWSAPERLAVNDGNWEDGVFISPDGETLYFTYYPAEDFIAAAASGKFVSDLDVYVSKAPFTSKKKFDKFFLSEKIWSEGGVMIDAHGNFFYNSNRDYQNDQSPDDDLYRNGEMLAFNDDGWADNPHYCAAKDELYFSERDDRIWVLRDAEKNGFAGTPELLPDTINKKGGIATQPFLTPTCETLYFSASGATGLEIFASHRVSDTAWGPPVRFIYGKTAVGEFSMTHDGKQATFLQVFTSADGRHTSDIFRIKKIH